MTWEFNIGDTVRLRQSSQYWGQSNDSEGTVLRSDSDGWHNVDWEGSDAYHNYEDKDLAPASVIYSKEFSDDNKKKDVL